ncbi:hypothetical protein NHH88_05905 [Oxalobacteraceae bacterium OTU3CAMAD1]|nr:hypothetical protein NHH88_05905 [Oxalobacteraceae bacterium OTU3CAMAD1]
MSKLSVAFLSGIFFFVCHADAQQDLPKSKPLLERRVVELADEARQKEASKLDLVQFATKIKQAQQCTDQFKNPTKDQTAPIIAKLRTAWTAVVNAKPTAIIDAGRSEYDELSRSFEEFSRITKGLSERCFQVFGMRHRPFGIVTEPTTISEQLLIQYRPQLRGGRVISGGVENFIMLHSNEGHTRASISVSEINSVTRDVEAQIQQLEKQDEAVEAAKNTLQQLADASVREATIVRQRIEEIDKLIGELDTKLSTGTAATDKQLIFAVYLMIVALLILFLGIRFLDKELATTVIENRSLVEVISMAFLLLTVIILGTGEKMPREAIGTLLGSIAGYIFGRKMSDERAK